MDVSRQQSMINASKMLHCVCSLIWMVESVRQMPLQDTAFNIYRKKLKQLYSFTFR